MRKTKGAAHAHAHEKKGALDLVYATHTRTCPRARPGVGGTAGSPSSRPCHRKAARCIPPSRTASQPRHPDNPLVGRKKREVLEEEVEMNWQTSRPCCRCQGEGVLQPRCRRRRRLDVVAESLPWTRSRARCCLLMLLWMVGRRRSASGRVHFGVSGVNTRDLDR